METQDYRDLLVYFIPRYATNITLMSAEEALEACKGHDRVAPLVCFAASLTKDTKDVYVISDRDGNKSVVPSHIAKLLIEFHREVRGL